MAITYTLEEAAEKLGMPVDEFRRRLKTEWTHLRPLRDGSTLRFKDKEINELARQIGFGSEEELQLADPSSNERVIPKDLGEVDEKPAKAKKPSDAPLPLMDAPLILGGADSGSDEVFLVSDNQPKPTPSRGKRVLEDADSDIRLETTEKPKSKKKDDGSGTDEIELDVLPPSTSPSGKMVSSSKSGKLIPGTSSPQSSSKSGKLTPGTSAPAQSSSKSGKIKTSDSTEFELTLGADSSSDEFELSLASDSSSDEISLGDLPGAQGASGINLGKPVDAGINLEGQQSGIIKRKGDSAVGRKAGDSAKQKSAKTKSDSDDEIDFELSLDQPGASSTKLGSGVSKKKKPDSSSEFELALDADSDVSSDVKLAKAAADSGPKKDIFETDFEIPALDDDSASEAVAIDEADTDLESSDFDLAVDETDGGVDDESASQVVALDDETEDLPAAKKPGKAKKKKDVEEDDGDVVIDDDDESAGFDDVELDEDESVATALQGATADDDDEEEEEDARFVVAEKPAPWGFLPALFMIPAVVVLFAGAAMGYELVRSMWGYHQPSKPVSVVIENVTKALDMQPKE